MNNLEKKVNLLVSLAITEDFDKRKLIREALAKEALDEEIGATSSVENSSKTAAKIAEEVLQEVGVPVYLTGHERLVTALVLVVQNPSLRRYITSLLYPRIAAEAGDRVTPSQVERNIRHAIDVAWDRGDLDVFQKYFGNTVSRSRGKPTNSEFISQLAFHISRRMEQN